MLRKIKLAIKKKLGIKDWLFILWNKLKMIYVIYSSKFFKSDIACICYGHITIFNFIRKIEKKLKIKIHYYRTELRHRNYKKIIIINGHQKKYNDFIKKIPKEKTVFVEVAFFPQNKNVYFDPEGIHGYSSIRNAELKKLGEEEKKKLNKFKKYYTKRNFVKDRWEHTDIKPVDSPLYNNPFIFVPLQLEQDTAYYLTPYKNNQEIINFVESCFPNEKIIFKAHPHDLNEYTVSPKNILLDRNNKDLQILLQKAKYVIAANSTVILEALMHGKICASLGEGFSTNHDVCLECHKNRERLKELKNWEPDWDKVDQLLYFLLQNQVKIDFEESKEETDKLKRILDREDIF